MNAGTVAKRCPRPRPLAPEERPPPPAAGRRWGFCFSSLFSYLNIAFANHTKYYQIKASCDIFLLFKNGRLDGRMRYIMFFCFKGGYIFHFHPFIV